MKSHHFSNKPIRMLRYFLLFLFSIAICSLDAQEITVKEVTRIETTLSSDAMEGRRAFTPGIEKAANFIAEEFKSIGLKTLNGSDTYLQKFVMVRPKFISVSAIADDKTLEQKNIIVVTCKPDLKIDNNSGYEMKAIAAGANLTREAVALVRTNRNLIVMVDESHAANFSRLTGLKRSIFKNDKSTVFILGNTAPKTFAVEAKHEINEQSLSNVVGILPGKSKKDEYVVFSGHYDHLGIGKPENGDSIYNGANDDASGTTAMIILARYFKALGNNERTLVFAAFTAEEMGGYGSQFFSQQFDPSKVVAMLNIEMIGTDSKWGKNSAYITGFDKTDLGTILQKNLEGTGFNFNPDPYPQQNLFYRSDNATLARLGVPAHTISTSKMDSDANYHKVTDEVETLDMENMTMIIRSIAISAKSIIAGKDTPARVKMEDLK
jgi:Zn-dependent M28 family amino/carboxypeptidase